MFRLYYISDSTLIPSEPPADSLVEAIRAGVEMVQIREKHRPAREVLALAREVASAASSTGAEVYVNGRFDIAMAAGVTGVHLPSEGLPAEDIRRAVPGKIRVGRSTHSPAEAAAAEKEGADFVVLGPVFETPSKARYGPPVGLGALEETLRAVKIPVYAVGGIGPENVEEVLELPVSGVAVISAIALARDRAAVIQQFRAAARRVRGETP